MEGRTGARHVSTETATATPISLRWIPRDRSATRLLALIALTDFRPRATPLMRYDTGRMIGFGLRQLADRRRPPHRMAARGFRFTAVTQMPPVPCGPPMVAFASAIRP